MQLLPCNTQHLLQCNTFLTKSYVAEPFPTNSAGHLVAHHVLQQNETLNIFVDELALLDDDDPRRVDADPPDPGPEQQVHRPRGQLLGAAQRAVPDTHPREHPADRPVDLHQLSVVGGRSRLGGVPRSPGGAADRGLRPRQLTTRRRLLGIGVVGDRRPRLAAGADAPASPAPRGPWTPTAPSPRPARSRGGRAARRGAS